MADLDSPAVLVARFLKSSGYEKTLDAFLQEAALPPDTGSTSANDVTIEQILQEKRIYDLSLQYEKTAPTQDAGWTALAPSQPLVLDLPQPSNILHVAVSGTSENQEILASTADRRLLAASTLVVDAVTPALVQDAVTAYSLHDSPILSWVEFDAGRRMVSTSMSGQVVLSSIRDRQVLAERRDHRKYVVKAAIWEQSDCAWLVTAAWDATVFCYKLLRTDGQYQDIPAPFSRLELASNPEDLVFVPHPNDVHCRVLVLTRRDSTHLYLYALRPQSASLDLLGSQNLAPHATSWAIFSPACLAPHPHDPSLLAIATSALPHLKLILVRLRIPALPNVNSEEIADLDTAPIASTYVLSPSNATAASSPHLSPNPTLHANQTLNITHTHHANEALASANADEAAIIHHISTGAPQTTYSTPQCVWRPDGSGVWVNGEDGVIRGIEAASGKVVARLGGLASSGAADPSSSTSVPESSLSPFVSESTMSAMTMNLASHEPSSKIRTLWAGWVHTNRDNKQEWLISGGFDRRVVVWPPT